MFLPLFAILSFACNFVCILWRFKQCIELNFHCVAQITLNKRPIHFIAYSIMSPVPFITLEQRSTGLYLTHQKGRDDQVSFAPHRQQHLFFHALFNGLMTHKLKVNIYI